MVQGVVPITLDPASTPHVDEVLGRAGKETYTFLDDDIARFLEEARSRRGTKTDGAPVLAQASTRRRFVSSAGTSTSSSRATSSCSSRMARTWCDS